MRDAGSPDERLNRLLQAYPPGLLAELERLVGTARGRPVATLLLDPERIATALSARGSVETDFLAFIARAGGEVQPGSADWWLRRRRVADPVGLIEDLAGQGLLFHRPPGGGSARVAHSQDDLFTDPRDLWRTGKVWVPEPVAECALSRSPLVRLAPAPEPLRTVSATPWELVRQLFLFVRLLEERPLRLSATSGRPAADQRERLAETVGARSRPELSDRRDSQPPLDWLQAVAMQAGLAVTDRGVLRIGPRVEEFFGASPARQWGWLLEASLAQTEWGELETAPGLRLERGGAGAADQADIPSVGARIRARRRVLQVLALSAEPDVWHRLEDLQAQVIDAAPDFLVHRPAPARGGQREPFYRGIQAVGADGPRRLGLWTDWPVVEGAFIAGFATGALHWLGLLDLGQSEEQRLLKLSAPGLGLLDPSDASPFDEAPPGRFFVQPNFEVVADGGGDNLGAVWRLMQVADLLTYDRAALLQVTRASVVRALDSGLTRDDVQAVLGDQGRVPVPQNVAFSVQEWAEAYDRYELFTDAWVVEADTAAELDALVNALPDCLTRLGATTARVLPGRAAEVEAALAARPDVATIDHAEGLGRLFTLDADLIATPVPERWHWYPQQRLGQIAEPVDDAASAFRLTRGSVQRGLALGLTPDEIEGFVEGCAVGGLTPAQRLSLRGWLGRYESAALTTAKLLCLPPGAAGEVLAVPEVREQVLGWVAPSVYVLKPGAQPIVQRLLEQAGIAVGEEWAANPLPDLATATPSAQTEHAAAAWGRRHWRAGQPEPERLALIQEAVETCRRIAVSYESIVRGEPPRRWILSPQTVERSRWGQPRLHAYCHQREAQRVFDLSRMVDVTLLDEPAVDSAAGK